MCLVRDRDGYTFCAFTGKEGGRPTILVYEKCTIFIWVRTEDEGNEVYMQDGGRGEHLLTVLGRLRMEFGALIV